ncbi:predicted protein, partial [Postia placenta Mad-698-R]
PFTNDFPRVDIHEMLSGDLLHQVIKGAFKDNLITWIGEFLVITHGDVRASEILDEIDRRLAVIPPFSGLRHFHQGRNFKQWTGDDSKGLMKASIYLPAISGLVPPQIVRATSSLLEFTYLVRRSVHTETTISNVTSALQTYHRECEIFRDAGVRPNGYSTPRQHSLGHFPRHIRNYGAPNGLCTSITELKHIKAVKEPWRRSNCFDALGQMLLTNQRFDKLAAARADFTARGMLNATCLSAAIDSQANDNGVHNNDVLPFPHDLPAESEQAVDNDDDEDTIDGPTVDAFTALARRPARGYCRHLAVVGEQLQIPELVDLVASFLLQQLNDNTAPMQDASQYRSPRLRTSVFHSAVATFYAPSDLSGRGGMKRERIRATPSWRSGAPRYDTVLINKDPTLNGFRGMYAARVRLLFSFWYSVEWFLPLGDEPDEDTGMWIVEPELDEDSRRPSEVIHLDSVFLGVILFL